VVAAYDSTSVDPPPLSSTYCIGNLPTGAADIEGWAVHKGAGEPEPSLIAALIIVLGFAIVVLVVVGRLDRRR